MIIVKVKGMIISNTTITNMKRIKMNNMSGNKLVKISDLNMIIKNSQRFN